MYDLPESEDIIIKYKRGRAVGNIFRSPEVKNCERHLFQISHGIEILLLYDKVSLFINICECHTLLLLTS